MACMDKAKTMSPTTLVSILNKVMENVYTNLDVTEMASILSDVANYQIVAQDGVPFEDSRATAQLARRVPVLSRWIWKQTLSSCMSCCST